MVKVYVVLGNLVLREMHFLQILLTAYFYTENKFKYIETKVSYSEDTFLRTHSIEHLA